MKGFCFACKQSWFWCNKLSQGQTSRGAKSRGKQDSGGWQRGKIHPKPWHLMSLLTGVSRSLSAAPLSTCAVQARTLPPALTCPALGWVRCSASALRAALIPLQRQELSVALLLTEMPLASLLPAPPGAKRGLAGIFLLAWED